VHEKCKKQARTYKKQAFCSNERFRSARCSVAAQQNYLLRFQVLIATTKNNRDGTKKGLSQNVYVGNDLRVIPWKCS